MHPHGSMRLMTVAAALAAATGICAPAAAAADRPAVSQQQRDDDCGAAALSTLFALAGSPRAEAELLRGHTGRDGEGLRASDLVHMTRASGAGFLLKGVLVRPTALADVVRSTPVIILLQERDESSGSGFGHFVVVEGFSGARGFLVADPALGGRGFVSAENLLAKAHKSESEGQLRVFAMFMVRETGSLIEQQPISFAEEQRLLLLDTLHRQRRSMPKGRTLATLAIGIGSSVDRLDDAGELKIVNRATDLAVQIRTGIGREREVAIGIAGIRNHPRLTYRNETALDFGGHSSLAQITAVVSQSFVRRRGGSAQAWAGIALDGSMMPQQMLIGASMSWQIGKVTTTGVIDAQVYGEQGRTGISLAPSAEFQVSLGSKMSIGGRVGVNYATPGGRFSPEWGLDFARALGDNWSLAAGYSRRYSGSRGTADRVQIALTYMVPRKLRSR